METRQDSRRIAFRLQIFACTLIYPPYLHAQAGPTLSTWYEFLNQNSGSCVDAAGWGTSDGTPIQQWSCGSQQDNQEWQFVASDSGYYTVISRHAPSEVLEVVGHGTANGTAVDLWSSNGGANQQWMPVALNGGTYKLVGRESGRCLDVPGASTSQGIKLQIYDCNGTGAQSYTLPTPGQAGPPTSPGVNGLSGPYTDPTYLTALPFGSRSDWVQPWRAFMQTRPASVLLNGMGINFDTSTDKNENLVAEMLAKYAIKHARLEIGWGQLDYKTESSFPYEANFKGKLLACKAWGIRPVILLNANSGAPTPFSTSSRVVTANAPAGASQVTLSDTSGLIAGFSGLSNLTDYWAAEALIVSISGNVVTLSKPLPNAIAAGTSVPVATLKYRPFSPAGTSDYQNTVVGWQHYVNTVAEYVTGILGTDAATDKGFDMEIWNELTFGSHFLNINDYYNPELASFDWTTIETSLVKATADDITANASLFQGVEVTDGFANTIPWTASSTEPARVDAISKHPYPRHLSLPSQAPGGTAVNALLQVDTSGYVPTYTTFMPEYGATAIQTETLVRDMGPITNSIYGTQHGENARTVDGLVKPVTMWMTEVNIDPTQIGIADPSAAQLLKGKSAARLLCFFLNKGFTQVDLFAVQNGGDLGFGTVLNSFLDYTTTNTAYPVPDTQYVSPTLAIAGRIGTMMKDQLDSSIVPSNTRSIQLNSITDTHNHFQFAGDGTAAHPPLYDREVFAFLPYQVNAHRFVIPYYVMTRNLSQPLATENFSLSISGLNGTGAVVTAYDPVNDVAVPVTVNGTTTTTLDVTAPTSDVPYLLVVQEAAS